MYVMLDSLLPMLNVLAKYLWLFGYGRMFIAINGRQLYLKTVSLFFDQANNKKLSTTFWLNMMS